MTLSLLGSATCDMLTNDRACSSLLGIGSRSEGSKPVECFGPQTDQSMLHRHGVIGHLIVLQRRLEDRRGVACERVARGHLQHRAAHPLDRVVSEQPAPQAGPRSTKECEARLALPEARLREISRLSSSASKAI